MEPIDGRDVEETGLTVCGALHGGIDPFDAAARLEARGWRTFAASWHSYEAVTGWCRIEIDRTAGGTTLVNGVVERERFDELARVLGSFGGGFVLELYDGGGTLVGGRGEGPG
ncbi:hypothetical protein ACFPM3_21580 [Streptomyces coeruleoprunus]|uniref:Uncharacterized protein n=1 Tax=Streptomyces coeruleoprunus TaxID=285563 RepID=A0ABV9XH48_9ACTN